MIARTGIYAKTNKDPNYLLKHDNTSLSKIKADATKKLVQLEHKHNKIISGVNWEETDDKRYVGETQHFRAVITIIVRNGHNGDEILAEDPGLFLERTARMKLVDKLPITAETTIYAKADNTIKAVIKHDDVPLSRIQSDMTKNLIQLETRHTARISIGKWEETAEKEYICETAHYRTVITITGFGTGLRNGYIRRAPKPAKESTES